MEMIDGITVLNTLNRVNYEFGWTWVALIPIALAILFLFITIYCDCEQLIFLLVIFAVIALGLCITAKEYPYTAYEVTIKESVSLQEFNERYEIIEQRGEIYVIKEKE